MNPARFGRVALLLGLLAPFLAAQNEPSAESSRQGGQEPQFRVDVNLVTVRFSVKDRGGNFVNHLTENDFAVTENGVRQRIAFFQNPARAAAPRPVTLLFLIDVSGSTFGTRTEEIVAADNFLRSVASGTETAVYGFAEKLYRFQDFTSDPDQVRKGFERARRAMGRTSLYASLAEAVERITRRPSERRRVVVVISDGEDPDTERAESVVRLALARNVTVYTIWVPSARSVLLSEAEPSVRAGADRQHAAFAALAARTGGRSFESLESIVDFEGTLAEINAELFGSLYATGYYTEDPNADRLSRRIEVTTSRAGYRVQGIFANLPERLRAKKQFVSALFNNSDLAALPQDLHTRFHELGAELDLLPMKPDAELEGLPFRIQVSPFSLAGYTERSVRTQLGIVGILVNSKGEEVTRVRDFLEVNLSRADLQRGRSIVYNSKIMAPPGYYDLRLAILDLSNWRMTAFESKVWVGSN